MSTSFFFFFFFFFFFVFSRAHTLDRKKVREWEVAAVDPQCVTHTHTPLAHCLVRRSRNVHSLPRTHLSREVDSDFIQALTPSCCAGCPMMAMPSLGNRTELAVVLVHIHSINSDGGGGKDPWPREEAVVGDEIDSKTPLGFFNSWALTNTQTGVLPPHDNHVSHMHVCAHHNAQCGGARMHAHVNRPLLT